MAKSSKTSRAAAPLPDNPAKCGHGGESGRETSWSGASSATYGRAGQPVRWGDWQRTDDRINEEVCQLLTESPAIDAGDIEVTVKDGTLTLSGTVADLEDKRLSEELVRQTPGVRNIQNQLRVRKQE
jgi:osmotically-inducible protein OsmY